MPNEKLQYIINREAAKVSRKIDKYKYLTVEEILLSDQTRLIEQAKFSYSFGAFKKLLNNKQKQSKIMTKSK